MEIILNSTNLFSQIQCWVFKLSPQIKCLDLKPKGGVLHCLKGENHILQILEKNINILHLTELM
jgi:hypothetical protein